jgi:flagellar assembly protein FliH
MVTDSFKEKFEKFQLAALRPNNMRSYSEIKKTFQGQNSLQSKQFHISEMVANQLSLEDEEVKLFEKRVQEEVSKKIAVLQEEAQKKGHEEGVKLGTEKAYAEQKALLDQKNENLSQLISFLDEAISSLSKKYEIQLTDVAFKIAEIIINAQIQKDPSVLSATVTDILEKISKEDDAIIKFPKEFAEILPQIESVVKEKNIRPGRMQFEVDSNLKKGDVIVECSSGEIASYIEQKISVLKEEVFKQLTKGVA